MYISNQRCLQACVKIVYGFSILHALNCPRLMMMSGDVVGARSRRLGLQCGNSVGRAVFLSKREACRGVLPNEDLPDQKCPRLGCNHADVVEVGRTVRRDTVKRRDCYFELYSLWHWEPMKHVENSRRICEHQRMYL